MDPGNEIDLYRMIDLLHVPAMSREIEEMLRKWHKSGLTECERKSYIERNRHYHKMFFEEYFKSLWADLPELPPWQLYWFELRKYDGENWRITDMRPLFSGDRYYDKHTVLPGDIIKQISEVPADPDKVLAMEGIPSKLPGRTLDIKYVRSTATYLYGTVKEHRKASLSSPGDIGHVFRSFYHYRDKYREEAAQFTMQFVVGLPPFSADNPPGKGTAQALGKKSGPPLKLGAPLERFEFVAEPLEKGIDIYYLIQLSEAPGLSDMLLCKLEELSKGRLKEDVQAYEVKKEHYYKTLFLDKYNGTGAANGSPPLYWFVATKYAPVDWGLTILQPEPPVYETHHKVLPREFLRSYLYTDIDPDNVHTFPIGHTQPLWKAVELKWVRYSNTCIMGTVQEDFRDWKELVAAQDEWLKGNRHVNEIDKLSLYRLLSHHLRQPGVVEAFVRACSTQLLPKLAAREKEETE